MLECVEIRCPTCRAAPLAVSDGDARCGCGATFLLHDGVLDLIPDLRPRRTLAQAAMQAEPIVRIYESRFWRRSAPLAAVLGLSFEREVELILEAAALAPDASILDLACGPGIYSRELARRAPSGRVVGLDISAPMLRAAFGRARREGLENLTFVRASALELPFADGAFDAVNCCGALHLFPDIARALSEVRRVLAPRGRVTVAVARRPDLPLARLGALAMRRLGGVEQLTQQDLESRLLAAGLADVHFAHAARGWMIASATRRDVT